MSSDAHHRTRHAWGQNRHYTKYVRVFPRPRPRILPTAGSCRRRDRVRRAHHGSDVESPGEGETKAADPGLDQNRQAKDSSWTTSHRAVKKLWGAQRRFLAYTTCCSTVTQISIKAPVNIGTTIFRRKKKTHVSDEYITLVRHQGARF